MLNLLTDLYDGQIYGILAASLLTSAAVQP